MTFRDVFKRLGLGKNAPRIYEALLSHGQPMLVGHIAHATRIARPEIYRNIGACLEKGFIHKHRIGKRTFYSAANPEIIYRAFGTLEINVEGFIQRELKKNERAFLAHISYFKGPSGIRAIFDDVVERTPKNGTFYRYTSEQNLDKVNQYLSPGYRTLRDRKKLERLVISNPRSGRQKKSRLERFIKYIPPETDPFDQNIIQLVYADSVAFINLTREEGYIIRDAHMSRFQSVIFRMLYKKL